MRVCIRSPSYSPTLRSAVKNSNYLVSHLVFTWFPHSYWIAGAGQECNRILLIFLFFFGELVSHRDSVSSCLYDPGSGGGATSGTGLPLDSGCGFWGGSRERPRLGCRLGSALVLRMACRLFSHVVLSLLVGGTPDQGLRARLGIMTPDTGQRIVKGVY